MVKYFLAVFFLLSVFSEAFCSDGKISSGKFVIMCIDDSDVAYGKGDFIGDSPVIPFNEMLSVKDDSELFKFRLHTHFLFNYDSHRYIYHSGKLYPKNPDTTGDNIHSTDYYIYTLEKIVI
ncbi:MAG: hypothetical protein LBL33_02770 [Tannerella sp.]|nr:hypothetical protein [Tannerella sp.]